MFCAVDFDFTCDFPYGGNHIMGGAHCGFSCDACDGVALDRLLEIFAQAYNPRGIIREVLTHLARVRFLLLKRIDFFIFICYNIITNR